MGANVAKQTHAGLVYYPSSKLVKFPDDGDRKIGSVVKSFHVLPPGHSVGTQPDNFYWWAQVEYVPFEDDHLYVAFGGYLDRPRRAPLAATHLYQGRVYSWNLTRTSCVWTNIKGTQSSAMPNVCVHPGGACVLYAGKGMFTLQNVYTHFSANMAKAGRGNSFKKGAVSPNGFLMAVIAKRSFVVELILCRLEGTILIEIKFIDCHKVCPGFRGESDYRDLQECKFSMDSTRIAMGSSQGDLFVVDCELNSKCVVCPGIIDKAVDRMANERCFDFDTRYLNRRLALGSEANNVYICDLQNQEVVVERQVQNEGCIQCVRYSRTGHCLAVASSLADIHILHPDSLQCRYTLSAAALDKNIGLCTVNGSLARTLFMSFDTSGEHLAVSYTDGFVRVWQLEPILNLQHMCRATILQHVHLSDLKKLPLPRKVIREMFLVAPLL